MAIQGPFPSADICAHWMTHFVHASDIPKLATVCKLWNEATETSHFWENLYVVKGIPMVSNEAGPRNYRNDFHIIYPATKVSGEIMRKVFGEPMGRTVKENGRMVEQKMPCISVKTFNKLPRPGESKKPDEIVELIVEYPLVKRVLGTKDFPFALDAYNNLVKVSIPDGEKEDTEPTVVPFTLNNRITLLNHPLTGEEHMPVFSYILPQVLSQCNYSPVGINVWYQTRTVVDETRNMPYDQEKTLVHARGEKVVSLGVRMLSDGTEILLYGTCPDDNNSWVRTSTQICCNRRIYQVAIGGFAARGGVSLTDYYDYARIGVVSGGPAEVLPALGS